MTWVSATSWSPAVIEQLDAFHDINNGVVVASASPRCNSERTALMAVLGGLGKDPTTYGVPNDIVGTRKVLNAWVRGEAVHTVILRGAQRWQFRELGLVADQLKHANCQLIPVVAGSLSPGMSSSLDSRFGARKRPDEFVIRNTRTTTARALQPLTADLEPLRIYRLPYIAAVASCLLAGVSGAEVVDLPISAHKDHQDLLTTPEGLVTLPPGSGRFLHAQRILSATHKSPFLLSRFGRQLSCADVSMATLKALGDHGIFLPASA